ncbi:T9SS type A sorting domain-containing protein [Paucihalobacter ruber]|uniref:T9SS type A sorting domain-containing protein n=1 Tax=Paucihalobacter ruber TaxID=2567861 RepID=A0A506PLY3_9FLAO|nr:M12 family metallo-peptidase [Paucihalobacter ruber]TPV34866.1 T9SS type A sorting domain-containing protein [Paucihalobacter ruber]
MNKKVTQALASFTFIVFCVFTISAQNIWQAVDTNTLDAKILQNRPDLPIKEQFYKLNLNRLKTLLADAPSRSSNARSHVEIGFPNAFGKIEKFQIFNAPVIDESLQEVYPELGSYIGKSLENPSKIIRFSISENSFKAISLNDETGTEYIEPAIKEQLVFSVFNRKNLPEGTDYFECGFDDDGLDFNRNFGSSFERNANDGQMREYKLAMGCTEEYAAFHVNQAGLNDATDAQKKAAVLVVMNDLMTRVNAVYENEVSLTMILVPTNENVIFLSSPFLSNNNLTNLISESQQFIDAFIGTVYDIGHMLCTGPGGLAQLNSPCTSNKARGVSGSGVPAGIGFEGVLKHEIGHQFGSRHTFNGNTNACGNPNQRDPNSAYEPGSGSTIMAYPGICGVQNVQNNRDLYFHQRSLEAIWANISAGTGSACPNLVSSGNSSPIANAGPNYNIPIGTPYKLTGSSADPDGTETHTYSWEQYDLGPSGVPSATTAEGPLVRSFLPSASPVRYVPRLSNIITSGASNVQWEQLPVLARVINYRFTVRDNDTRGGNNAFDEMTINTVASGFFRVTSQNTLNLVYEGGSDQTVSWDVAGTTGSGINTSNVNILLSIDGGQNFNIVLASNTPNDGTEVVTMPNVVATQCRIMVEAVGNIFFNVNNRTFQIQEQLSINDDTLAANFRIYPNPSDGNFEIQLLNTSGETINLQLFDLKGRVVYTDIVKESGEISRSISVNNLSTGVYLLKVSEGNKQVTKKVVIQ